LGKEGARQANSGDSLLNSRVRPKKRAKKIPKTAKISDAKLRPSLSLRPQFGAGWG